MKKVIISIHEAKLTKHCDSFWLSIAIILQCNQLINYKYEKIAISSMPVRTLRKINQLVLQKNNKTAWRKK